MLRNTPIESFQVKNSDTFERFLCLRIQALVLQCVCVIVRVRVLDNFKESQNKAMGMPKKENGADAKDAFAIAKRPSMHSKKDCRHNLQRNISRMFSNDNDIDRNR